MSEDSPSGISGDDNSSDRILQSLRQDADHCMAILMSTSRQDHTGIGSEHHLKSSLIKPEDARDALHRMKGLLEEALMLEDVHHQLEQWFASITANLLSLSWTASVIPDLLTLLEILDQHDCAKHYSQEIANRVKTWSHSTGDENQNHIASILCTIMDILSSVKNLEDRFPLLDAWLTLLTTMFNDQNSTTHTIHILSSKLLKLSNIERVIEMIINVSKNINNLKEEQQISLLWLGVMMEEVQHSSNSNTSIFRQFSIFNFDSLFLLPKMNSYLNNSSASSSQTTTIPFEIACNIVAGGAEDYSQSKLLTFLKKCIVSSHSKLVVLLLDGFLVRMLSEQARDIEYEELESVNISAWKLIFDNLLNSIGEEVKPQLIDAFANTALMAKKLISRLIAIAFCLAKSLGALDRHLFETLSICVVELFLKLQNANDFKALLDQCLEFVNGKEMTIEEQKGGEAYLSELVLIGIIDIGEHDKDIDSVVTEADVVEKINILQTMLAIADRLPKDVLDKVLQKIHTLLSWTCRGSVDNGPRMVETKLYDLLTLHLVQLHTSRHVILNSVAFKGIHGVLYEKLKQEVGQQSGEELTDLAIGVIATPASAWLEVLGGKCAIKPHLEQLIGLISSIEVVKIIFHGKRELKPLSAIVEQILSSSTIEIGLLEMKSSIDSKVPHCYFQETKVDMEKWYNNGRNNLQFIIHRLLIKYAIASNLVKVTILAIHLLSSRSEIDLSLHKIEENETISCDQLQPIKCLIEELQVISYFLLIMIESCFQLRKEAIRHKEQTKTVNDLEDFDDGTEAEKAIAGCEDIIIALQEMDINSFQHLQDIIRLETKKIHILKNRANEGSESEFSATRSQSWAISVEAALCWFISLSNDFLPLKEDCKLYLWWECKLTSLCHAVYILHRAVDSHEGMHEVGGKISNEAISVDKALVIIDNVFNFYNEVLSVEAQQQRIESLLSNAIAAQEWIAEKKSTESRQINKSKKKLPIIASDIQVKRYFDNYNGIHRFADIFTYMSNFPLFVAKEDSPSSSSSDDDSEVFNAFRRTATSLKNKWNRGSASKFMTIDQLFSSVQLYAPNSSSYCTSMFTSLKLYLGSIYQQLNPLERSLAEVENASAVINLDHRWLDDAIRPLKNESMDVNILVNNDSLSGIKIDKVFMTLRYEVLATMCSVLRCSLNHLPAGALFGQEASACYISRLKTIMLIFSWDLLNLFTSFGIMTRTFKDYLRSIAAIMELVLQLQFYINKPSQSPEKNNDDCLWAAYLLMQILQQSKGLDKNLLRDLVQVILTLSGPYYQRLICKYLLYSALIGKNPALVAPSFLTSTLLSQDSMHEENQIPKNNSSKKKQLPTKKSNLHRDTLSYSSLSSFDEGNASTMKQQPHDDQYKGLSRTERLRWRLRKHFENNFLVFIQTEDQRVNPIDANTFIRINDNKVADVIIYEVISMLSDKLTDYHKSMLSLQTQSTEQKDMTKTVKIEIKQEDQDMKEQQLLVQLQRDAFELADLLNLLLIQESCARSIITTKEAKGSTPGSANTSPSRRRQQFDHFCLLKSLELRTVQTFFVLLTSLIEELCQETKLLLGVGRGKNSNVSCTTTNGIQAPIAYYSQMVGGKLELLEYSRLPLLSNGLGMIIPTLAHLNIGKVRETTKPRDRSDSFDAGVIVIEDDSGGVMDDSTEDMETVPSFSLRQTLLTIAKFLVMNNTFKSGSFKLIQSPKSPVKSSAASHKKVTGLINRLKSLRQQLTSLSTNIIKFNPPLNDEFLLFAAEAQNLCEDLNTEFAPLVMGDDKVAASRKLSNSIAMKLFNDTGEDANYEGEEDEDLTARASLSKRKTKKSKKRARSRNKIIDEWLHDDIDVDEEGLDAYADLEDFIVGDDVVD